MRLSELSTDRATDLLCEIVPYISNICTDDELLAEIKKKIDPNSVANRAEMLLLGVEKVNKIVPILLKTHKGDVFSILGALNEKTPEEIGKQSIITTMMQIRDIAKDRELVAFFTTCVDSEGSE